MGLLKSFLMSQINNILYATNKGNLTDNNNVFSEFSSTKYLLMQKPFDYTKNITFNIRFTTSNDITDEQVVFWSDKGFGGIINNNNFYLFIRDNLGNDSFVANFTLNTNTEYELKIVKTNNNISWYFGTPNNLIQQTNINNRDFSNILTYQMIIGYAIGSYSSYFRGSIDMNYTNIKINSVFYKIQVVVGYTIVGSPTIVDGVVSGFTNYTNYLTIPRLPQTYNIKILTKINWQTATGKNSFFSYYMQSKTNSTYRAGDICINASKKLEISYFFNGSFVYRSGFHNLSTNIDYFVKAIITNNSVQCYYSTDKVNWILEINRDENWNDCIMKDNTRFGVAYGIQPNIEFRGSMDMNETEIEINNKLWFNGQPS